MTAHGRLPGFFMVGALAASIAAAAAGCSSSGEPVAWPVPGPTPVGSAYPAGALLLSYNFNVFQGCTTTGGGNVFNYNYEYVGSYCNDTASCSDPRGDQNVYLMSSWASMPGGETQYPVTAVAGNVLGVIFGGKKDPVLGSCSGVAMYQASSNTANNLSNTFDSPITALTPPLDNGDFFVGMESGRMDLCSIYNTDCTAPFNSLGYEITALALDPANFVVWAGTSQGDLLACSLTEPNRCTTMDQLGNPVTAIVPYNGKVGVLTDKGVLLVCPYPSANSCETLQTSASGYLGAARANGSLYLLDGEQNLWRYPLPFDPYSRTLVTGGWSALAAEGSSVYGLCGNGVVDVCTCDSENSCSPFSQLSTNVPGSGGWERNAIGVLSSLPPMPPSRPPMTLPQTHLNATAPVGGQCSYTVPVQYPADTVTVNGAQPAGSCVGPQTSCSFQLSDVPEGSLLQEQVSDGTPPVTSSVSCTVFPVPMEVSPTSFNDSSPIGCAFGPVSVTNANGTVTLSGIDATILDSTCWGPSASCNLNIQADPGTGGQGVLSDGLTEVSILVQCNNPN